MKINEIIGTTQVLYHGTSRRYLPSILTNGLEPPTYWGDERKAHEYANEFADGVVIAIPLSRFDASLLRPNENFVEIYQDEDPELYDEWMASGQTWQDSLNFFDSVVYHGVLEITQEDLH